MSLLTKYQKQSGHFSGIMISLASPESILERSHGEVTQSETINYRTHKPEMKGLFCERIFGPVKDWECHCGKYKGIRYKGIICDRCGVEITKKKTRRERMGHIVLPVPVVHIWHFRALPNKMSYLLGLSAKHLEQIIYYERYIVIQAGVKELDGISKMDVLTEEEYLDLLESLPFENQLLNDDNPSKFVAKMGAEALEMLLKQLDLHQLAIDLRARLVNDNSQQSRLEIIKRLKIVEGFKEGGRRIENRPEWMIIRILPVIPPGLRPLFPLGGGKFATSDCNELYRACLIRCNRYNRLKASDAPEIILRHECRMIQEICDALIDNSRRTNSATSSESVRKLKSFADALKGKQGRFRQNLLGKRVDYSGRSVIVVGPELLLHECGLPKDMALELFTPFVIRRLIERGIAATVKIAKKIIEEKDPVIWDILENVLKGHPILLNRAPTLHRLSIQAFQPKLIEGKSIQLHPLVCTAFNADFDGDQMAVHVPLSQESITEVSLLMLAPYNILNPSNGIPIIVPSRDIVLGLFYITKGCRSTSTNPVAGEGMYFYSPQDLLMALDHKKVSIHAHVKVKIQEIGENNHIVEKIIDTVAGRVVFNQKCPQGMPFINETITSKKLQSIVVHSYIKFGIVSTATFLDDIKKLGFQAAFKGGMTIGLDDIKIPAEKRNLIQRADEDVEAVWENYMMGLITDNERYNQVIDIWTRTNTRITNLLIEQLEQDQSGFNSIYMMMQSGARGSREQVRQLGGMRGLIAKPQKSLQGSVGEIIETPITSNFQEGLNVIEYFISTHGARKGLADTALKTADAGYLTRRLVDVAQDVTVSAEDCGTLRGILIKASKNEESIIESLEEKILGRVVVYDIYNPNTKELIIKANEEIVEEVAAAIHAVGIEEVWIRSLLTCALHQGVCIKCYGRSLASGQMVSLGEAVGVIAAQSIGEPGTQLTLRTFHVGGTASNVIVDSKVKSISDGIVDFDSLYTLQSVDKNGERVDIVMGRSSEIRIIDLHTQKILMSNHLPYGAILKVKSQDTVSKGQELYQWDPYNAVILAIKGGLVRFQDMEEGITFQEQYDEQTGRRCKVIIESKDRTKNPSIVLENASESDVSYTIPVKAQIMVEEADRVQSGDILAKIPRIVSQSRDITGGLPRVIELFEARSPDNTAIMSDINGIVTYGSIKRGYREIVVESKLGMQRKYMIPLSKHIIVQDNDYVKVGDLLTDGEIAAVDVLAIQGPTVVQEYIINELQEVYRLQGVKINNKHIEIIIRQMMRKVEVIDSGDTTLLPGQIVDKVLFFKENDKIHDKKVVVDIGDSQLIKVGQFVNARRLKEENAKLKSQGLKGIEVRDAVLAIAQVKLQGITQSSLGTESFISAASFQETARVLSDAAISAKYDPLKGLKENVIVGHLIPAGTGRPQYEEIIVNSKKEYEELVQSQ